MPSTNRALFLLLLSLGACTTPPRTPVPAPAPPATVVVAPVPGRVTGPEANQERNLYITPRR